jgi:hypothetical protein
MVDLDILLFINQDIYKFKFLIYSVFIIKYFFKLIKYIKIIEPLNLIIII